MDENNTNFITVDEVKRQQIVISEIAIVCAIISAIVCGIIKFSIPIIIGIFAGCLVNIGFHFWLFYNLKHALEMEKDDAVNYANIHSAIRKVALIIVLVCLVANPVYKINALGLVISLFEFRLIIYGYNLYVSKKQR